MTNLNDASMLDLFRMEVESQVTILNDNLLALETNPKAATELEALMRASHSIKGAARIVQLDAAVRVAHVMEDCFVAAQKGAIVLDAATTIDTLLQAVDMIFQISRVVAHEMESWMSSHQAEVDRLVANVAAILQPQETSMPAASPPPSAPTPPPAATEIPAQAAIATPANKPVISPLRITIVDPPPDPGVRDPAMLALFRIQIGTHAAFLQQRLNQIKREPQLVIEVEPLLQAVSAIKGSARIVQFNPIVQLAQAIEQHLLAIQKQSGILQPAQIEALLSSITFLVTLAQTPEADLSLRVSAQHERIQNLMEAIALSDSTVSTAPTALPVAQATPVMEPRPIAEPSRHIEVAPIVEPSLVEISQTLLPTLELAPVGVGATTMPSESPASVSSTTKPAPTGIAKAEKNDRTSMTHSSQGSDRVVRVSADNLNRIMGLAGESLVEANWLQPFADSLFKLRTRQVELYNLLSKLQDALTDQPLNQQAQSHLGAARHKIDECRQILADRLIELELFARRSGNLSDRLYREVIASHMRPFADGVQNFPRMMRDLARRLNKQVKFEILGKATQVDRDILEKLEAPLTHILRNAVDHGLELPEERIAVDKPPEGTVRMEAAHRAGMLSITITDDGRGVDPDRLRQKIVNKGMISAEMADQLTEIELMEFLFLPGFSTAKSVTEISGRGVGLDVVQSMVQEVGGIVRAVSQPGKGMSFHLQLPLTLSVIRTLLVEIAGEAYAFPLTRIDRIVTIQLADVAMIENRQYFVLDGQNVGLISAHHVLDLNELTLTSDELSVVIVSDRSSRYGLVVDRFLGERDLVVRPLDLRLGKVADISAAALMPDGSPVLILDVEDMIRSIDKLLNSKLLGKVGQTVSDLLVKKQKRILVVDDSVTVRETERKMLERRGYEVDVAVNGIDGWNAVRRGDYDLVISDIDMPRMNGFELVAQIKNHSRLASLPVIIVSYKDRESDRIRGLEVGADYYLTKSSFQDETFIKAVYDLIGE